MKRYLRSWKRYMGFAVAMLLVSTCSSADNVIVDESSQAVIPARTIVDEFVGNFGLGFENFNIEQSEEFQNGGYTKDQIDSVRVLSIRLEVLSPAGGNFDFLDSIAFYAEAEGLPRIQIASLAVVPDGERVLEMDIDDAQLVEYVVSPSVTITTDATGTKPAEETTIKGDIIFDVDVNVSGSLGCNVSGARVTTTTRAAR